MYNAAPGLKITVFIYIDKDGFLLADQGNRWTLGKSKKKNLRKKSSSPNLFPPH